MSDAQTAVAEAPAGSGGVNGDLPLGLQSFRTTEQDNNTKPDDASPAENTDAEETDRQTDTAPQTTPEPQPEPIPDQLMGRARTLGMSDEEIKGYRSPGDLDRFVSLTERNVARIVTNRNGQQQQQPDQTRQPEKPAETKAEPEEEDWASPILEKFKGHEYDKELIEDVGELTGAFKSQLHKRDETIKELRAKIDEINQRFFAEDFNRDVAEFDGYVSTLNEIGEELFGKGNSHEINARKDPKFEQRTSLWKASDEIMALARSRGEFITRKEATRRAYLIDWSDKAKAVQDKKSETPAPEQPRDKKSGQFISAPRKTGNAGPATDPETQELKDVGNFLRERGLKF